MAQSNSRTYRSSCLLKDCKGFYYSEKSTDSGQCHLSRNRSRQLTARRRSNSISMCTLPSIPEYPDFQDIKKNYSRSSNCRISVLQGLERTGLEHPPNTKSVSQNRNLGYSADHFTNGHSKNKSSFCDKPLQEYFNDRLSELRNYETKASTGMVKDYPNENQNPSFTNRTLRRRSSCSAVIQATHLKLAKESYDSPEESYDSPDQTNDGDHDNSQDVQDSSKRDYLECLMWSINGPLQMLVRRK